jgi:gamma-glutamyltranspeptidase/glutathione hydrolase
MTVGSPGGSTIITSVLQTILNVYEYNLSMQEAVLAPPMVTRFDHIRTEYFFEYTNLDALKAKAIINEKTTPVIGKVDAILVLPNNKKVGDEG